MITFRKAIAVHRPPYDFLATGAYATDEGTLTECLVVNGTARWADTARLAREADRAATAGLIAAATSCDTGTAEGALLELHLQVEAYLRGDRTPQSRAQRSEETPEEPMRRSWPILDPSALYGLAGDVVRAIEPESEADPAALLVTFLLMFGMACGHGPHAEAAGSKHTTNENAVLLGPTGKGRKGSSWGPLYRLFESAEPGWSNLIATGLSSGEGVIYHVRDSLPANDKGETPDPGVKDKRLLVLEEEFAATLKIMAREGNSLSGVLRQAWDHGNLRTLTRNSPLRATNAHFSALGHATEQEIQRNLNETEAANGFANRILWICSRRSKLLPDGGGAIDYAPLVQRLTPALEWARGRTTPLRRDNEAARLWFQVYGPLSEGKPGLVGAVIGRAEAHVLRLSLVYALLDRADFIRPAHLRAALAFWQYAEDSARYVFGDRLGDPIADTILEKLRQVESGLDRTAISALFGRNQSAARIGIALQQLTEAQLITATRVKGEGPPRTTYRAAAPARDEAAP